jgi:hypothetical protein
LHKKEETMTITVTELRDDPALAARLKKIEAEAARTGYDLSEFYAGLDAAYQAGCDAGKARQDARRGTKAE